MTGRHSPGRLGDVVVIPLIPPTVAALWVGVGLLVEDLPRRRTARSLRRRSGALVVLTLAGILAMAATGAAALVTAGPTAADRAAADLVLAALPAVVAAGWTVPRLRRLRSGTAVFSTAGGVPVPPALRSAAAHPVVAVPPQITGLAVLAGLLTGGRLGPSAGWTAPGIWLSVLVLGAAVVGIRHAIRHSTLGDRAVPVPVQSPRPVDAPRVEQLQDRPGRLEPPVEPFRGRPSSLGRQFEQQAA